jgi:Uma2 family endonuclease
MSNPTELFVTADIPPSVQEQISSEIGQILPIHERHVMEFRSTDGPSFVQLVADAVQWITPLKAAATVFLSQLAKNAADEVWKNKAHLYRILKDTSVDPLYRLVRALAQAKRELSAHTRVVIGLPIPQEYLGTLLALETVDEVELAWTIANFVDKVDKINNRLQQELAGGHEPLSIVRLIIQPDGSFVARWEEMNGRTYGFTICENSFAYIEYPPLVVQLRPVLDLTVEQFFELAAINRDLRMELTAGGELIVMPPTGGQTGNRNAEITMQLRQWAKDSTGTTFDSSSGFRLPNGSVRSPDASWVERSRLDALTAEQLDGFIPLCPDFVLELRSPTDNLNVLQNKMEEYLDNGARLGWLIDPADRRVYIYRPQVPTEQLENPEKITGDPILAGFELDLQEIW